MSDAAFEIPDHGIQILPVHLQKPLTLTLPLQHIWMMRHHLDQGAFQINSHDLFMLGIPPDEVFV